MVADQLVWAMMVFEEEEEEVLGGVGWLAFEVWRRVELRKGLRLRCKFGCLSLLCSLADLL